MSLTGNQSGRLYIVNYSHPYCTDCGVGTKDQPFRSIGAAVTLARPGDTVLVHGGVYREMISPSISGEADKPITIRAQEGETVTVKGSEVFSGLWEKQGDVWHGVFDPAVFGDFNPYAQKFTDGSDDPKFSRGQVILDGMPMSEVAAETELQRRAGTWMPTEGGAGLMIHFLPNVTDPSRHLVEYSVRNAVFRPQSRGLGYITIEGFVLEHAANQGLTSFWDYEHEAQLGLVSTRSGHHFVIRGNTIRLAKSIGIDVGSEGRVPHHYGGSGFSDGMPHPGAVGWHLIEGNIIAENGQGGLAGMGHIGTVIRRNVFERNNTLGGVSFEEAAIKTHWYFDGVIEENLFRDNYCDGIWLDNVYQNVRITRNVILSCHGAGIFCEMGPGPCLIDHNVIGLSLPGNTTIAGNGIYAHDAGNVTISNNLLIQNSRYGLHAKISARRSVFRYPKGMTSLHTKPEALVPCDCSGFNVVGNLFSENGKGEINLPYPGPMSAGNISNYNIFCTNGDLPVIPNFSINTTSGVEPEMLRQAVEPAEDELLAPNPDYAVTMKKWQKIMGLDSDSGTGRLGNRYFQVVQNGQGMWLKFKLEGDPLPQGIPAVDRLDRDLSGEPVPASERVPGPFQQARMPGSYRFQLWPFMEQA